MGESMVGLDVYTVVNPALIMLEKGKEEEQVKVSINPMLFTRGSLYQVQPASVVGSFQCFDKTVHQIYETTLKGGTNAAADAGTEAGDASAPAESK